MKRRIALLALLMVVVLSLAGCGNGADTDTAGDDGATPPAAAPAGDSAPDGLEAIATDGPGESAALAAVPAALDEGKAMRESSGLPWPDVAGLEPRLTAYILAADMSGQTTLFEVRADGVVHSIYAFQRAFDAGSLLWSASENSSSPRTAPQSDTEMAAVAAVEAAMKDSFPEDVVTVSIYGYRFVFLDGDLRVLDLEVDTAGSVISVGS